jgi:hypothetical protein
MSKDFGLTSPKLHWQRWPRAIALRRVIVMGPIPAQVGEMRPNGHRFTLSCALCRDSTNGWWRHQRGSERASVGCGRLSGGNLAADQPLRTSPGAEEGGANDAVAVDHHTPQHRDDV